jgi:hypothetical protein
MTFWKNSWAKGGPLISKRRGRAVCAAFQLLMRNKENCKIPEYFPTLTA